MEPIRQRGFVLVTLYENQKKQMVKHPRSLINTLVDIQKIWKRGKKFF